MDESVRLNAERLPGGARDVNWGSHRSAAAVVSWRAM